jgi:hypothetical protein
VVVWYRVTFVSESAFRACRLPLSEMRPPSAKP